MEEKTIIKSTLDNPVKLGAVFGAVVGVLVAFLLTAFSGTAEEIFFVIGLIAAVVIAVLFRFIYSQTEIIVSNRRVYGKTAFGKQVDLPLDSISAVGTSLLKGIAVSSSSGKIAFKSHSNLLIIATTSRQPSPIFCLSGSVTLIRQHLCSRAALTS